MAEGYARELVKIVIAQVCQGFGYNGVERTTNDVFVDIIQAYVEEIGYLARYYAEQAGRFDCNFNDVVLALGDLQVSLKDLMAYHSRTEEDPFPRAIPRFPVSQRAKRRRVTLEKGPAYIPSHFPPLPEGYSFSQMDVEDGGDEQGDLLAQPVPSATPVSLDSLPILSDEEFLKLREEVLKIHPELEAELQLVKPAEPEKPEEPTRPPTSVRPGLVFKSTTSTSIPTTAAPLLLNLDPNIQPLNLAPPLSLNLPTPTLNLNLDGKH